MFSLMLFYNSIFVLCITLLFSNSIGEQNCHDDLDCDTSGSFCVNSFCVCRPGYVVNSDKTKCLQISYGFGATCEDNVQCSAVLQSGGQCINDQCQCAVGFHYLRGQCFRSIGMNKNCKNDNNCFTDYNFEATVCKNNKCQCADGYYLREYSSCRRASYAPGEQCGITQDCKFNNSVCTMARICDYTNTTQPTPPTILQNIPFYEIKNTLFYKTSSQIIGGKCDKIEDCYAIKNSFCSDTIKECQCISGYYSSENMDACYPEIGISCTNDTDCVGKNTMCFTSKYCTCRTGFVADSSNRFCMKLSRNLGWSCLHDRQCSFFGMGGVCINKKCMCSSSTHFEKSSLFCWRSQNVGESCLQKEDCFSEGATCDQGVCKCLSGFHVAANFSLCRKNGILGDTCVENSDCVFQNSTCSSGICQCLNGYYTLNNKCATGIGGTCEEDQDCSVKLSQCIHNHCICPNGYVSSNDYRKCLKIVTIIGNNCLENLQCRKTMGSYSSCIDGKCACLNGSHFVFNGNGYIEYGQCYLSVKLEEVCTQTPQCLDQMDTKVTNIDSLRAVCRKGFCRCQYGYIYDVENKSCKSQGANIKPEALLIFKIFIFNLLKELF